MTVWSPSGWAPSTPCGSCASPAISSSKAIVLSSRRPGAAARVGLVDQPGDGFQRDAQPARAVPGLVSGLVDRLVQLVRAQQRPVLARVVPGGRGVAVAERVAVAVHPLA